jgi:BirA family biotin operon repressor/biotin-[acetyl-CoA-carboxylase] ligase
VSTPAAVRHLTLVRLLADGRWHSGAALAAHLGITRAAVCKALHKAEEALALPIESVRGQGYRLRRPLELLDRDALWSALSPSARARIAVLEVLSDVDSTSSYLLRRVGAGEPSGLVCLAERQTAGRGRRGRGWVSPFGSNIYLSMLWRLPLAPAQLGVLSLAAGVAAAAALRDAGADGIGVKWPNDLHWQRRKLAGLLLEVSGEAQGPSQVVLGIGVNLRLEPEQGAAIDQPWVDLAEVLGDVPVRRNAAAAALIEHLSAALADYAPARVPEILEDWRGLDLYRGESMELVAGDRRVSGRYAGIDDNGNLLLDAEQGRQRFAAGEISLRPAREG